MVIGLNAEGITVATGDLNVLLSEFFDIDGRSISIPDLTQWTKLSESSQFRELESDDLDRLNGLVQETSRSESYWVERISQLEPLTAPFAKSKCGDDPSYSRVLIPFVDSVNCQTLDSNYNRHLAEAFLILVSQLQHQESFDVNVYGSTIKDNIIANGMFDANAPAKVSALNSCTVSEFSEGLDKELSLISKHGLRSRDLVYRFPDAVGDRVPLPVFLALENVERDIALPLGTELGLIIEPDGLASVVFDSNRIDEENVSWLIEKVVALAQRLPGIGTVRISDIDILSDEERRQILIDFNDTDRPYSTEKLTHQLVSEATQRDPDALALVSSKGALSYRDLDRRSNQVARRLAKFGIGRKSLVAVLADRSIESVVWLLGILKAGGCYLPIDVSNPSDRIEFILKDSGASLLLTDSEWRPASDLDDLSVIHFGADWEEFDDESYSNLTNTSSCSDLAYVIYTSGSTGIPKGVEIEHESLLNLISWHVDEYQVSPQDRTTLIAGPAFDASVWEIWPALCSGSCIYIPDSEVRAVPRELCRWFDENKITVTFLPTPLAESVLSSDEVIDSLRIMLTGGDRLHSINRELPFTVINHYGPTENTVVATAGIVSANDAELPSIGRPISNVTVYILDNEMKPVPIGLSGEIFIAGKSLARGYRNRPDLTDERFLSTSIDGVGPLRLYKTGDSGRYRRDGNIDFLDRLDDQVKIRGFRVELGEIESAILSDPRIKECASDRPWRST